MAVKRFRKYGKKRRGLRRRTTRRVNRIYRPMRTRGTLAHYFTRSAFLPTTYVTTDANGLAKGYVRLLGIYGADTTFGNVACPNISEFSNLFDKYKIMSYTFRFIPRYNSAEIVVNSGAVGGQLPTLYWVYDTNDSVTPVDMNTIMQYENVKYRRLDRPISITVKYPCVSTEIYKSGLTTAYGVKKSPWLDMLYTDVPHWGFKWCIQSNSPSMAHYYDLLLTVRFKCKNPK